MPLTAGTSGGMNAGRLFAIYSVIVIAACMVYVTTEITVLFYLAGAILFTGFIYPDYRRLFYLIFAVLPFSVEYYFEGAGLGTDLPSEPLMLILTGIGILVFIRRRFAFDSKYVRDPVFILLLLHLFWIFITSVNSGHTVISFKYSLAKIWYLVPFFYLPLIFVKEREDALRAYNILYKILFVSICIVLVRHAMADFSFVASYDVVRPFYRNHVNYAAIVVICLPFVWMFYKMESKGSIKKILSFVLLVFVTGIYFSYTRAAILSIFIAAGAFYVIKFRLMKPALGLGVFAGIIGILLLTWNNRYLDFAPEFERTITHHEFDNLLEATYKLEDISSMERVHRWMAGFAMISEKPWLGFGPATFYSEYKAYAISRFQTYVSDNPDQSGIHNYFLMLFVEQGVVGFMIFLILCLVLLVRTEYLYHALMNRDDKLLVMASGLSLIIILAMSLINDLIETDKVGPFFFFNAAILVIYTGKSGIEKKIKQKD
jgi:O-antigen ligase